MRQMKAVLYATGFLLLSAVCAIAQPPDRQPPVLPGVPPPVQAPAPTPEETIYAFVFWFNAMNLRECAALIDGAQFTDALAKMEQEMGKEKGQISVMIDQPRVKMINDDGAEVPGEQGVEILGGEKLRANVQTTVVTLQGNRVHRSTTIDWLQLRRVDNIWKLVPDDPKAPPRPPAENALQEFVNFIAAPVQARSSARSSVCLSNMRQLCLGMMQMAQDFDERLGVEEARKFLRLDGPVANWPVWVQAVFPYVKSTQIFRCPNDPDKDKGAVSYSFNENLEGVALAQIAEPAKVVMLYEGKDGKLDFRHDGRATIGFADGHVKLIGEEESKNLLWKP